MAFTRTKKSFSWCWDQNWVKPQLKCEEIQQGFPSWIVTVRSLHWASQLCWPVSYTMLFLFPNAWYSSDQNVYSMYSYWLSDGYVCMQWLALGLEFVGLLLYESHYSSTCGLLDTSCSLLDPHAFAPLTTGFMVNHKTLTRSLRLTEVSTLGIPLPKSKIGVHNLNSSACHWPVYCDHISSYLWVSVSSIAGDGTRL